jgi:hypothetical protein
VGNAATQEPVHPERSQSHAVPDAERPSSSQVRPLLENLSEGLLGDPLKAVTALIFEGFMG